MPNADDVREYISAETRTYLVIHLLRHDLLVSALFDQLLLVLGFVAFGLG